MNDNLDLSGAFEKIQDMLSSSDGQQQIQGMLSAFMGNGSESNENNTAGAEFNSDNSDGLDSSNNNANQTKSEISDMITPETIFKVQRIMTLLNNKRAEKGTDFLKSLKPLLKESRREKVDKAIRLMALMRAMEILKKEGGI